MIEIKKVLFPTHFSEYSQFALKYAAALADSTRAKLYVMHVHEQPVGSGLEAYHYAVPEYDVGVEKAERQSLDQFVDRCGPCFCGR